MGANEQDREAHAILERLGIHDLADRRPAEMSGGEQQRVGLGRALGRGASVQLFDEPTAHLDASLRERLQSEIAEQRRAASAAGIYATHDTSEALAIADRVALMRNGRIIQEGTPREVYEAPIDAWAARLTGPASELVAELTGWRDGRPGLTIAGVPVRPEAGPDDGRVLPGSCGRVGLLVRPDWASLEGPLPGVVARVRYRGTHTDYTVSTPAGELIVRQPGFPTVDEGVAIGWRLDRVRLLGG